MSRKNCRMTEAERAAHDRAVRLRKMTDQQLCDYMDAQHSKGVDDGIKLAEEEAKVRKNGDDTTSIYRFLDYLDGRKGSGNGIGGGTLYRIRKEVANAVGDGVLKGEVRP